jgi:hypothetical protein
MTTCYDDIEAVTRLLQEKEKVLKMSTKFLPKNELIVKNLSKQKMR